MRTPRVKTPPAPVVHLPVRSKPQAKSKRRRISLPMTVFIIGGIALLLFARVQYGRILASMEAKTAELSKAELELARIQTDFDAATKLNSAIRTQFDAIKVLHLNRRIEFAGFVSDNPSFSERILDEASDFAESNGLSSEKIRSQRAALPKAKVLPTGTQMKLLSTQHSAAATTVDVSVVDSNQSPVRGLTRVDFDVTQNRAMVHPVRVEPVLVASGNHRVSLLFDCSSSFGAGMPDAKLASKSLITELANPWKFRIVRFASDVQVVSQWSFDPDVHTNAVDRLVADGATSLLSAMEADAKEHTKFDGTHSTVILTDGKDSHGTANIEQILKLYQQSSTQVHILALDRGEIDEPLLRRIAAATDGSFQKLDASQQLAAGFKALAERMKRPVYRLTILGPIDRESLSIQLANNSLATQTAKPQLTSASNPR